METTKINKYNQDCQTKTNNTKRAPGIKILFCSGNTVIPKRMAEAGETRGHQSNTKRRQLVVVLEFEIIVVKCLDSYVTIFSTGSDNSTIGMPCHRVDWTEMTLKTVFCKVKSKPKSAVKMAYYRSTYLESGELLFKDHVVEFRLEVTSGNSSLRYLKQILCGEYYERLNLHGIFSSSKTDMITDRWNTSRVNRTLGSVRFQMVEIVHIQESSSLIARWRNDERSIRRQLQIGNTILKKPYKQYRHTHSVGSLVRVNGLFVFNVRDVILQQKTVLISDGNLFVQSREHTSNSRLIKLCSVKK